MWLTVPCLANLIILGKMVTELNTIEIIRRSELFVGLDDKDIQKIVDLPSCQIEAYEDQEIICEAGKEAKNLYIIEEGEYIIRHI